MERDAAWLALVSRLTDAGVLLLDGSGAPLAAEDRALRLLGCHSPSDLTRGWTALASGAADWCAAARSGDEAGGRIEIAHDHETVTLHVRVIRLDAAGAGADGFVALLTPAAEAAPGAALTSFARRLGHDLRGPLNAMVLNLDLIRLSVEDGGTDEDSLPKRKRYLASLQREIDRMSETLTAALEQVKKRVP